MKELELVIERKYELLKDDYIKLGESTAYRIRALKDFGNVKKRRLRRLHRKRRELIS